MVFAGGAGVGGGGGAGLNVMPGGPNWVMPPHASACTPTKLIATTTDTTAFFNNMIVSLFLASPLSTD